MRLTITSPDEYGYYPGKEFWRFRFQTERGKFWGETHYMGVLDLYGETEDITFNLVVVPTKSWNEVSRVRESFSILIHGAVNLTILSPTPYFSGPPQKRHDGMYMVHSKSMKLRLRNRGLRELSDEACNSVLRWRDGITVARVHST